MRELDERHLEVDTLVGDVAHVDLGAAQPLEAAHQGGEPEASRHVFDPGPVRARHAHEVTGHDGQEALAEILGQVGGQALRVPARFAGVGHGHERTS